MSRDGSRVGSDRDPASLEQRSVEEVEDQHFSTFAVLDESGVIDPDYQEGLWTSQSEAEEGAITAIVVINCAGPKVLVAVPEKVWHKKPAKRKMGSLALQRPMLVSVATCAAGEREVMLEGGSMKIWVGYINVESAERIDFVGPQEALFTFSEDGVVPLASALAEVASEHFGFQGYNTAESGGQVDSQADVQARRMLAMEEMLLEMKDAVKRLTEEKKTLGGGQPKKSAPAGASAKASVQRKPNMGGLGGLDESVVRSATLAGVPLDHLQEVSSILKAKPRRLDDLPRPTRTGAATLDPLEVSEEEGDLDGLPLDESGGAEGAPSSALEKAIVQLTAIASKLTENKQKKDPMDALLDSGGGSAGSGETSSVPISRKNAAALRALQKALQERPKILYQILEANMQSDYLSRPVGPGEPMNPGLTARGWLTSKSRIQNYPVHVRWAWQTAGILDCLMASRYEEARARAGLLLAAADQAAIDGGSWLLGSVALLENPPPYHLFSSHLPPSNMELQHSALLDPRWVETFLGHVKDVETYQEAKKKLGKPAGKGGKEEEDGGVAPKVKPKVRPKKPPQEAGTSQG